MILDQNKHQIVMWISYLIDAFSIINFSILNSYQSLGNLIMLECKINMINLIFQPLHNNNLDLLCDLFQ